jgi:hypothetical protein
MNRWILLGLYLLVLALIFLVQNTGMGLKIVEAAIVSAIFVCFYLAHPYSFSI